MLPPLKDNSYLLWLSCSKRLCSLVVYKLYYFTNPNLILLPGLYPPLSPGMSVRLSKRYMFLIRLFEHLFPLRIMTKTCGLSEVFNSLSVYRYFVRGPILPVTSLERFLLHLRFERRPLGIHYSEFYGILPLCYQALPNSPLYHKLLSFYLLVHNNFSLPKGCMVNRL